MAQKNKNKKPGGGGDTGGGGGGSGGLGITKADCEKVKQTSQSRFGGLILEMIISTAGAEAKNLGGRVALPPGKFLRVRKVFARNP